MEMIGLRKIAMMEIGMEEYGLEKNGVKIMRKIRWEKLPI